MTVAKYMPAALVDVIPIIVTLQTTSSVTMEVLWQCVLKEMSTSWSLKEPSGRRRRREEMVGVGKAATVKVATRCVRLITAMSPGGASACSGAPAERDQIVQETSIQ